MGGLKQETSKKIISKSHIQEMLGSESPGIGAYEPKDDYGKPAVLASKFGTGDKYDMYRFVKEATKSPGPIYNAPVLNDLGYKRTIGFGS